jgi:hypothetical protein
MKSRNKPIWSAVRLCDCCGRKIVLLLNPEWNGVSRNGKFVTCYERYWEGNPWYISATDQKHPARRYARFVQKQDEERRETEDPFFSLD